jgi:sugar phosphate isomerase/epimerase
MDTNFREVRLVIPCTTRITPKTVLIALQAYSLRDDAKADFAGTLRHIKEIGYEAVEFAGYYGMSSRELRSLLDDLGLKAVSSHVGYQELSDDLSRHIDYSLEIGASYLICPGYRAHERDAWVRFADFLSAAGEKCRASGVVLGYHNHSHEFERIDCHYILDILFNAVKTGTVIAQLDLGWVMYAGVDPIAYLKKYAGRCPLVHIKDFDVNKVQTEVGTGVLDLPGVVVACREAGVEWMIIETEQYNMRPIDSVRIGLENLRKAVEKS